MEPIKGLYYNERMVHKKIGCPICPVSGLELILYVVLWDSEKGQKLRSFEGQSSSST